MPLALLWSAQSGQLQSRAGKSPMQRDDAQESPEQYEVKRCPRCQEAFVKDGDDSCDHMTCTSCGWEFCWTCLADRNAIFHHGCHHHDRNCKFYASFDEPLQYLANCPSCRRGGRPCRPPRFGDAPSALPLTDLQILKLDNKFMEKRRGLRQDSLYSYDDVADEWEVCYDEEQSSILPRFYRQRKIIAGRDRYTGTQFSICLESVDDSATSKLLDCGHGFHTSCINRWRQESASASCPLCKVDAKGLVAPKSSARSRRRGSLGGA